MDYGQLNREREFSALTRVCEDLQLDGPNQLRIEGFGDIVRTGLTDSSLDIVNDAFTPCRNLILITLAASVAYTILSKKIVIGLLSEETILFPDQSDEFLELAEKSISSALGSSMNIVTPLRGFNKKEVVALSEKIGVKTYYSCHAGTAEPCGNCIACKEYEGDC